jgi:hypothetical protein
MRSLSRCPGPHVLLHPSSEQVALNRCLSTKFTVRKEIPVPGQAGRSTCVLLLIKCPGTCVLLHRVYWQDKVTAYSSSALEELNLRPAHFLDEPDAQS